MEGEVMAVFYQNILTEIAPYCVKLMHPNVFGEHRHADIELHYCIKGSFEVIIDKKEHQICAGELLLISPMTAHSFPENKTDAEVLVMIVGVSLLKKYFSVFADAGEALYLFSKEKNAKIYENLLPLLPETVALCRQKNERNDLLLHGNLYKICAYLVDALSGAAEERKARNKELKKVANIEKALEMIYYDYAQPLTVEDAATATGYGKSNFCKIFKSITGDTFHTVLNKQRVESACGLLAQTDLSIEEIAWQTGFGETKTFCRVFKSVKACTPRQYRKKDRSETAR